VVKLIQVLVGGLGATFALMLAGIAYQSWGTRRDARRYPAPGRLVDIGSHRLHVVECGAGSLTIVLESGLMSTVLSWSALQGKLAESFRVVSYDRAGLGWSDLGPMPRTADRIVDELNTLLERANVPPPYLLVGHSFGGLTMPLFAARFPDRVAGVVLIDPVVPKEWHPPAAHELRLATIGAKVCRRAALLARFGILRCIAALLKTGAKRSANRLVRLISRGSPGDSGTVSSPWFAALPDNEKAMASVFWIQPKFALTIASQLGHLPASAAKAAEFDDFCRQPVTILTAGTAPERRRQEHAAMAARLPLGSHILATNSNHWIMQEEPELVIGAIEKVVEYWKAADRPATISPNLRQNV
jgi:pimeloyl-ACP methyl ester carboxylesterase